MTLKRTLVTSTLAFALVATAVPAAHAWSIGDVFTRGDRPAAAADASSQTRVDPLASLTTEEKASLKTMTHTEREAFLKEKGITLPARGEGRQMKGQGQLMGNGKGLLQAPELSTEMKALLEELRTARENGDEAKITELRTKIEAAREADMTARAAAMDTAIAGGYETWKAYVTKEGTMPTEMIAKITKDNFATFAELHATHKKVRELSDKLGLREIGHGMKMEGGMGGHGTMGGKR